MLKSLYKILVVCMALLIVTGCGLDLQRDYEYKPSVADPHVKMTAWEYFHTREDLFSELIAAIEYTGLTDYYTQTETLYTYLALDNTAMQKYRENVFPGTSSIIECDKETVKKMLLYHIVDGAYSSYGELPVEPIFVLTLLPGEEGLMTMLVYKEPWQTVVGQIVINQYGSNGHSPSRRSRTSNILPVNGVIHVFSDYCYYVK